jgi:site-specific DNA-cytosine methylase
MSDVVPAQDRDISTEQGDTEQDHGEPGSSIEARSTVVEVPTPIDQAPAATTWTGSRRARRWVSDSARYKQLGNSVCVPVVQAVTDGLRDDPERRLPGES